MKNMFKTRKQRKGFSLVELVVVILIIAILAVAVFAGGSAVVKKSQVSRTTSDLHNFSVAVEAFLNENPSVANKGGTTNFAAVSDSLVQALNANLPEDYQLTEAVTADVSTNITYDDASKANVVVYKSAKTDSWDNNYYVIFDSGERHGTFNSDFYVYVVSAGPDAKTDLAGTIGGTNAAKADNVFLLAQYENGDVSAVTYDMSSLKDLPVVTAADTTTHDVTKSTVAKSAGTATYTQAPTDGICATSPVNF